MRIDFTLGDSEFNTDNRKLVIELLALKDEADLEAAMQKLCKAATLEYLDMFLESGMPSRADEIRQVRLYFLLLYYYKDYLPPESEVSAIFQLTASQGRTLLRTTRSRYRTKIAKQVRESVLKALIKPIEDSEMWEIKIDSNVILEELNLLIVKKKPGLTPVQLKRGSAGKYVVDQDTLDFLKKEYGID
ncbi:MAG TPA: hypothetical protein VF173_02680 [Thermoanaerobaculia bacterium]|nr:hypothetical protein [Thermoanaerobaculia bacterium]